MLFGMDENQISKPAPTTQTISLKEQFTKVTPLSRFLAMVLFVALPFIGLWFGLQYNKPKVVLDDKIDTSATRIPAFEENKPNANKEGDDARIETKSVDLVDFYYESNEIITFETILVRGKLSCSYGNTVILMSWPNPYGDPLPYLELFTTQNTVISWMTCDDPWYVDKVASGDDMVTVKGVVIPRTYGEGFPDPYANHPDRDKDIIKYRGVDFFIVDRSY